MKLPFLSKKGKKKGKGAEESRGRGYPPTDRVKELMSRGFSELDTIDVLRREGFSADEIDRSLTQAVKEGVGGPSGAPGAGTEDDFDQAYQRLRDDRAPDTRQPPRSQPTTGPADEQKQF